MDRSFSLEDETRSLKLQLRERGRAGLFVRGRGKFVRLGLALIGAVVVLATVVLYPTTAMGASGAAYPVAWGLPMWLVHRTRFAAIGGCLLMFPYWPEDEVVIDASGNLSAASEHVVLPPHVPPPRAPASA